MTSTNTVKTIEWANGAVRLIDQTRLPDELVVLEVHTPEAMVEAIQSMRIRGAPALGVAGAYGLALAAQSIEAGSRDEFLERLRPAAEILRNARPTAVNLAWGVDRVMDRLQRSEYPLPEKLQKLALAEAARIHEEDLEANRSLGRYGAELLPESGTVLTHCNAGALATAGYGTALGVLRAAWEQGKALHVLVDETRPLLQGARLTTWELSQEGIPATLIADSMAGYFLHAGRVNCVVVGADRIAANGDVANKIGTYSVAVLAKENGVPFYVAAPTSTIDLRLPTGDGIPIEERRADEVTSVRGVPIAPAGMHAANPAFDVTPARYVTAIITERGVVRPPYDEGLRAVCGAE